MHGTERNLSPGDTILVRNYSKSGSKWKEGVVTERMGSVTYNVNTADGQRVHKHIDQLVSNKIKRFSWRVGETENANQMPSEQSPNKTESSSFVVRPSQETQVVEVRECNKSKSDSSPVRVEMPTATPQIISSPESESNKIESGSVNGQSAHMPPTRRYNLRERKNKPTYY